MNGNGFHRRVVILLRVIEIKVADYLDRVEFSEEAKKIKRTQQRGFRN